MQRAKRTKLGFEIASQPAGFLTLIPQERWTFLLPYGRAFAGSDKTYWGTRLVWNGRSSSTPVFSMPNSSAICLRLPFG